MQEWAEKFSAVFGERKTPHSKLHREIFEKKNSDCGCNFDWSSAEGNET